MEMENENRNPNQVWMGPTTQMAHIMTNKSWLRKLEFLRVNSGLDQASK